MKPAATNRPVATHLLLAATAAMLLMTSGCCPSDAGQDAVNVAADLLRQLLASWML